MTGRGTGIDDHLLTRKTALVAAAAARARYEHGNDALAVLAEVGGLEHAALVGFVVGAAALQVPVVIDGVIAAAGLLVASKLVPGVERCVIAGHRSVEPGASAVLAALGGAGARRACAWARARRGAALRWSRPRPGAPRDGDLRPGRGRRPALRAGDLACHRPLTAPR